MKNWMNRIGITLATMVLMAPMAMAEGILDQTKFKVDTMTASPLGNWLARIMAQVLFMIFELALVIGIGLIVWNLVLMLVGKKDRGAVGQDLMNKLLAIFGIIVVLTGGGAWLINTMTTTASNTIDTANKMTDVDKKAAADKADADKKAADEKAAADKKAAAPNP